MPGPGLYTDFEKSTKDLLTKDFPDKPYKVEFVTKCQDVEFSTNFEKTDTIKGTFAPKWNCNKWGVTVKPTIESPNAIKLEVTHTDKLVSGLKTTASVSGGKAVGGNFSMEYLHDQVAAKSALSYKDCAPMGLEASLALLYKKVVFGGALSLAGLGKENNLKSYEAGAYYKGGNYTLGSSLRNCCGAPSLVGNYWHSVSGSTDVGGKVTYDLTNPSDVSAVDLTVGAQHKINNEVTLKGKVGTSGRVGASIIQKLCNNVTMVLNASSTCGPSAPCDAKFNLHLSYKN